MAPVRLAALAQSESDISHILGALALNISIVVTCRFRLSFHLWATSPSLRNYTLGTGINN